MSTPFLSQPSIVNSIHKHKRFISIVTVAAAVVGAIFYWTGLRKYEATSEFVLRNPLYTDRGNMFSNEKTMDYFAGEDDIDKIILLSGSDLVQKQVIRNMHLADAYKVDTTTRKGELMLQRKFHSNLKIIRTEFKALLLGYTDTDPDRAAAVANETVHVLETTYGEFYQDMRRNMYMSIMDKIRDEDSSINALTDTLAKLRDQYHIYDIISPGRNNIMLSGMKAGGNGQGSYGMAIERIQNIESLKDELVTVRAKQTTLANQYVTGNKKDQLPVLKVVTEAKNPVRAKGPGGILTVIISAFLGLFFSIVYMLLYDSRFWAYTESE